MSITKPRPEAWWKGLTVKTGDRAYEIASEERYRDAGEVLRKEFKLDKAPSVGAIVNFRDIWHSRRAFLRARELVDKAEKATREASTQPLTAEEEAILVRMGQATFTAAAIDAEDSVTFTNLVRLRQKDTELALEREKAATAERQKDEALALDRARLQREKCDLVLTMLVDRRAAEIANSDVDYSERIEQLGRHMFGADWELEGGKATKAVS